MRAFRVTGMDTAQIFSEVHVVTYMRLARLKLAVAYDLDSSIAGYSDKQDREFLRTKSRVGEPPIHGKGAMALSQLSWNSIP